MTHCGIEIAKWKSPKNKDKKGRWTMRTGIFLKKLSYAALIFLLLASPACRGSHCDEDFCCVEMSPWDSGEFDGIYDIQGVIELPEEIFLENQYAVLRVYTDLNELVSGLTLNWNNDSGSCNFIDYEIESIAPGNYRVRLQVFEEDEMGDETLIQSGWYDGTTDAPILEHADATDIVVNNSSLVGIDFGIGLLP